MFVSRREFDLLDKNFTELLSKVKQLSIRVDETERKVYEETTPYATIYGYKYKTLTCNELFDLIFNKIGVKVRYVAGTEASVELVSVKKPK